MNTPPHRDTVVPVQSAHPPLQAPIQKRVYTPRTERDSDSCSCLMGMTACVGFLALVAIVVSTICFFVSGLVFTIQEYPHIPDCAEAYRAWSITMVTLFGISVLNAKNAASDKFSFRIEGDGKVAAIAFGFSLWIIAIFPGLIAGLGSRDVLHHPPNSCDLSHISQLITWTRWVVYYNWTICGLLIAGGFGSCLFM